MSKKEIIFGFHAVKAILEESPHRVVQLCVQEGRDNKRIRSILHLAAHQHIAVQVLSRSQFDQWTNGEQHQGVLIEARSLARKIENDLLSVIANLTRPALLLVVDQIQDPHNLGACLRSANATNVDAVILTRDRSVNVTPVVRKVAAGATETTPIITVTNLANTLRQLKKLGIWIYGLDSSAHQSLYTADLTAAIALVLGGEGQGLRRLTKALCDNLLVIPMQGTVESLNVSVATGVCLFEVLRQRAVPCPSKGHFREMS